MSRAAVLITMLCACKPSDAEQETTPKSTSASDANEELLDAPQPSGATGDTSLDPVWDTAISEPADDGVYVVDSFVAAWLFARAASGAASEWQPIEASPDGEPAGGYRLAETASGSPYTRLGLREGDVVESLNGVVLSSPDRFGFALDGAESLVVLAVYRDGTSTKLQYQLIPGATWTRQLADYAGDPDPTVVADASAFDDTPEGTVEADAPTAEPREEPMRGDKARSKPRPTSSRGKPAPRGTGGTKRPASPSKVRCSTSTKCTIDANHFQQLVAAPSRLQSQVDVVPAIRSDVFSGYKLKSVRRGSDAAKLGFRAGDKITHINGHDLTNDGEALQLYMSLGASRVFKIRYERSGKRLVKTVSVV